MRTLTTLPLLLLLALASAGCKSGLLSNRPIDGGVAPSSDGATGPSPETMFARDVQPMLDDRCGGCHGAGRSAPDFLRPNPDERTGILSYPALVDLSSPATSRLVTKGAHTGPALSSGETSAVLAWLRAEAAAGTTVMPTAREYRTTPVEIHEGFNAIALDVIGLPATSIHFVASRVGGGMFLDAMQLSSGPDGARLDHPVFVTWTGGVPTPDPVDRFAGLVVTADPNSSVPFDSGTVVITSLPAGSLLSIQFAAAGPTTMPTMPGTDAGMPMPTTMGCMHLDTFRASAVPPLRTYCTRCHGGSNANATAAVDMSQIGSSTDATALTACNQILGRISPATPSASGLFTQPDPASTSGHPFQFGTSRELDTFRTSILDWFSMEAP